MTPKKESVPRYGVLGEKGAMVSHSKEVYFQIGLKEDGEFVSFDDHQKAMEDQRAEVIEECIKVADLIPLELQHHMAGQYSGKALDGFVRSIHRGIIEAIRALKEKS